MIKKAICLFKKCICFLLVVLLSMHGYCAQSANDGNAFITKEEFDLALADFNNRLSKFEAGINSKIDSQVTSYLDRNGIWSKKDQMYMIKHNRYWWGWTKRDSDKDMLTWMKTFTPTYQRDKFLKGWINDVLVKSGETFNKSGLCFIVHMWKGLGPEAHVYNGGGGNGDFDNYWNYSMALNLHITTSSGKGKIVRRLGYGDVGAYHNNKSNLHFEDFDCTDIMFVEKGETIQFDTRLTGSGTFGVPYLESFGFNKVANQTAKPITEDWDLDEWFKGRTTFAVDDLGKIYSCGWYKISSMDVY